MSFLNFNVIAGGNTDSPDIPLNVSKVIYSLKKISKK